MTDDKKTLRRSDIEEIRLLLKQLEDAATQELGPAPDSGDNRAERDQPGLEPLRTPTALQVVPQIAQVVDPQTQLATLKQVPSRASSMPVRRKFDPPMITGGNVEKRGYVFGRAIAAAGFVVAGVMGGLTYASVWHVPGVSPSAQAMRTTLTALFDGRRFDFMIANDQSLEKPAQELAAAAGVADDKLRKTVLIPVSSRTETKVIAVSDGGNGGGQTRVSEPGKSVNTGTLFSASMLMPISFPKKPPAFFPDVLIRAVPITLQNEALAPLSLPTHAPEFDLPGKDAQVAEVNTRKRDDRIVDAAETASAVTVTAAVKKTVPAKMAVASAMLSPVGPSVLLNVYPSIQARRGKAVPLGLKAQTNPARSEVFLLVARGIPKGVRLSKGSPIGTDSWFMPAVGLEKVGLVCGNNIRDDFSLKFELVTVDGRILSVVETSVHPVE